MGTARAESTASGTHSRRRATSAGKTGVNALWPTVQRITARLFDRGTSSQQNGRRTQMNRRTVIRLGALSTLAACRGFVPFASAQSKQMFKASDVHPAGYPTVVAVESLGK